MNKIARREVRNQKMADDLVIVEQGLIYAELNEIFQKHLESEGYAGMDYKPYSTPIEVTLKLGKTSGLLENNKLRLKQLITLIQMRFGLAEGSINIFVEQVKNRALNPQIQANLIKEKLASALPVRRAVTGALRTIMEGGAAGAQVIISGKIRGQRAKSYKVSSGILLHSGNATEDYVRSAQSSILLKQGVLGIKVAITLNYDATGRNGTTAQHPNKITIFSPEEILEKQQVKAKPTKVYDQK
ncbi:small subunit ribosomal protein S3e [Nematocida homosporus]|uniref:small subunit ribosomal protein S3e n=1 Tax=Nematocida homosporus TaxID=1912981 RepID=UPI00221EF447|nr:small subunit ribosomal protein S3e [Nematocida homosporus]KAI5187357.1 small subunit ribosomal protein S3e [Nematocida homosporus]